MVHLRFWLVLLTFAYYVRSGENSDALSDCQVMYHKVKYDLSKLSRIPSESWEVVGVEENHKFRLNICEALNSEHSNSVGAILQGKSRNISLGIVSKKPFVNNDRIMLRYESGDECPSSTRLRSSLLAFECDPWQRSNSAVVNFVADWHDCGFWFEVRTPLVCTGIWRWNSSHLCILGLAIFGGYLIIGASYNYFHHKARGLNVLPQTRFWRKGLRLCKVVLVFTVGLLSCGTWGRKKSNYHILDDSTNLLTEDEYDI